MLPSKWLVFIQPSLSGFDVTGDTVLVPEADCDRACRLFYEDQENEL